MNDGHIALVIVQDSHASRLDLVRWFVTIGSHGTDFQGRSASHAYGGGSRNSVWRIRRCRVVLDVKWSLRILGE